MSETTVKPQGNAKPSFDRKRSSNLTGTVVSLFKGLFGFVVAVTLVILVIGFAVAAVKIVSAFGSSAGTIGLLFLIAMAFLLAVVLQVALLGMVAIQIRNNDYLLDIHDEQKKISWLFNEFLNITKED